MLHTWKVYFFFSFISGLIGVFSFFPYKFWPISIFSIFGLLFFNIQCKKIKIYNYSWSIALFGNGIFWIYFVISSITNRSIFINIFLTFLLISYLASYTILLSILKYFLFKNNIFNKLLILIPVLWQIIEFFRSFFFTGFPWLQYGYSQINGPLKNIIPIFGIEFITFLLFIISGLFLYSIKKKD